MDAKAIVALLAPLLLLAAPFSAYAQSAETAYIPMDSETQSIAPTVTANATPSANLLTTLSGANSPFLSLLQLPTLFPKLYLLATPETLTKYLGQGGMDTMTQNAHGLETFFSTPFTLFSNAAAGMASSDPAQTSASEYPEIREILAHPGDVATQSKIYMELLKRVGPEKGQDALNQSGLPFTGETHLLQHTAGTYIYDTYGLKGITMCKLYFLGACYHEFFINLLSDKGIGILPDVMKECWKLGPLSANQCAHGIGHGLVVWYGYDKLDKAAAGCEALKKQDPNFPDTFCYEGVFMENFWALHPSATVSERWISQSDPYYPCDDPRIQKQWETGCWLNQGSLMYNLFYHHDIAQTSNACLAVQDQNYQRLCFNSLARQIHPLTDGNLEKAVSMCGQLDPGWHTYCLSTIAATDFANGGRALPFQACAYLEGSDKKECYLYLFNTMKTYASKRPDFIAACQLVTDSLYKQQCMDMSAAQNQ